MRLTTLILVDGFIWVYTIYCLFNGSRVKYITDKNDSKGITIYFGLIAVFIAIASHSLAGVISAILLFIAGAVFGSIPSGYNSEGVYINGNKHSYEKIKWMAIVDETDGPCLKFLVNRHVYVLKNSTKDILQGCLNIYNKKVGK